MKIYRNYLIKVVLLIFMLQEGCKNSNCCKEDPCIWIETNDIGNIIEKYVNYCDPSITDTVYHYFDNGTLKKIVEHRDGLENCPDGWVTFYDSLGIKTIMDFYVDGKPTKSIMYYPNRIMKAVFEIFNEKRVGNGYYYDTSGRFHSYVCYDFEDYYVYRKEYNKDRDPKISFQQDVLISQFWYTNSRMETARPMDMLVDSTYLLHVVIPKPPDNQRTIDLSITSAKGELVQNSSIMDTTGVVSYSFHFQEIGTYNLHLFCALFDPVGKTIVKKDSLNHKIRVGIVSHKSL